MSILANARRVVTPWHLWLVGVLALLWNVAGALDFVMTQTRDARYLANFSQQQLDHVYSLPTWVVVFWGIAVGTGVLGALLLLLRRRLAPTVFFVSLLALLAVYVRNYLFDNALEVMGDALSLWFSAAIVVVAIFLFFYAGIMNSRGVLR
ncbi:MAG: hypothetical protein ACK5HY_02580 [Parahaliea sp.]